MNSSESLLTFFLCAKKSRLLLIIVINVLTALCILLRHLRTAPQCGAPVMQNTEAYHNAVMKNYCLSLGPLSHVDEDLQPSQLQLGQGDELCLGERASGYEAPAAEGAVQWKRPAASTPTRPGPKF